MRHGFAEDMMKDEADIDMKRNQLMLKKAGECLRYALGKELCMGEVAGVPNHLNAFIVYMVLIGKIDRDSIGWIRYVAHRRESGGSDFQTFYRRLSKTIIRSLKNHFAFHDSESMIQALDEIVIPEWPFAESETIMRLFPDGYLVKDRLFFVMERNGGSYFKSVHVRAVDDLLDCDEDINVGRGGSNYTISKNYSHIIAYDEKKKAFYLRLKSTMDMFAVYYVDDDCEAIYHHRCLGIIGNTFPVIEAGDYLSVIVNGKIKPIKDWKDFENYKMEKEYIRVEPAREKPTFFKSYKLMVDGRREEYPYDEQASFLVGKIEEHMNDNLGMIESLFSGRNSVVISDFVSKGQIISLEYLDKLIEKYDLEDNRIARMYHFLNKLIEEYLPKETDVLNHYYMFADVSRRLTEDMGTEFISEQLYWRMNELNLSGRLERVIHKVDALRDVLLEDAYWDDESILNRKREYDTSDGKVGYFEFDDSKMRSYSVLLDEGIAVENSLVMKDSYLPGVVSFDLESGMFEIRYTRILNKKEKKIVAKTFMLEDNNCRFYIDCGKLSIIS